VYAFRCSSQRKILAKWHSMDRHHWPTKELRDEVIKYPAHLVPVGCKGSPTFVWSGEFVSFLEKN